MTMIDKTSAAVAAFRQHLESADPSLLQASDPKVREKATKDVQNALIEAIDYAGLDDYAGEGDRERVASQALSQMPASAAGAWLAGVADAAGVTVVDLKAHIAKAMGAVANEKPSGLEAFLAALQPAPVAPPELHPSGVDKMRASSTFAITGDTGPAATPIVTRRTAIGFDAKPGTKYRVVNLNAFDKDGQPKVMAEGEIPKDETSVFGSGPQRKSVAMEFPRNADVFPGDTLVIQVEHPEDGTKGERELPLPNEKPNTGRFKGTENRTRPRTIDASQISLAKETIKGQARAVDPFSTVVVLRNGLRTELETTADKEGRFSLKIPKTWKDDNIAVASLDRFAAAQATVLEARSNDKRTPVERNAAELFAALLDGRDGVSTTLENFAPGAELTVALATEEFTFTADADGKMQIDLAPIPPGSTVKVKSTATEEWVPGTNLKGSLSTFANPRFNPDVDEKTTGRLLPRGLKFDLIVPDAAGAARRALIQDAIQTSSHQNVAFAMDLFGPDSQYSELSSITDTDRIRTIFRGAQLGMLAKSDPRWLPKLESFVKSLAQDANLSEALQKDFVDALQIASGYTGDEKATADGNILLSLERQGATSIVTTGGYSPISGSHGPLRPEQIRSPDVYRLTFQNLDWLLPEGKEKSLRLETGGRAASGWVNPAAITFTVGR